MYSKQQQFESRAVFIQYNTWIHLTTFHHNVQNCKHDHHHRDHSCMQLLQACTHTTRECAFSLIILFTYCILPINGHKQENKSIKLTCCVLLASKFVDITEISVALFMEADAGWYNTEKMELSSSFSNTDPTMLCHMVNVDTQFPVSFLANSASVQSHATHFRAQSKSFFPSNFSKCFSS